MIGPPWLAAVVGVLMIGTALCSLSRITVAWRTGKATDFESDGCHTVMAVAMAGMLLPGLGIIGSGTGPTIWAIVWALIAAWFAVSVARDASRDRAVSRFTGHHLPHLVLSAAMIYMLAVSRPSTGSMSGMTGMGSSTALVPLVTLDLLFLFFTAGYAVLILDRLPVIAVVGSGDLHSARGPRGTGKQTLLAPRLAAATSLAMALAMGYMLTMMLA